MMKTISRLLAALIGAALVALPLAADAKPKKEDREKRSEAAEAKKKSSKASPPSVERSAPRSKAPAKAIGQRKRAPEPRTISKSSQAKSSGKKAQQRRVSAPSKPSKKATAKATERRKAVPAQKAQAGNRAARPQRELKQAKQKEPAGAVPKRSEIAGAGRAQKAEKQRAAEKKERVEAREGEGRTGKIADRRDGRAESEQEKQLRKSERRAQDRTDRREAREESAEERQRRAERVKQKQRVAQHRQRQIAERRERARDRVERFRENRRARHATLLQQRRAIRETRREARREYVEDVREEIRDYWEDRAEETRYHVRDRCDHLFDDDWWEDRSWHRGPLLVSDPWWWWRPARFDAINVFIGAGWSEPVVYDYGADVIYDEPTVYVRGEAVGTREQYSRQVVQLANPVVPAVAAAPVAESEWRSLGVWALVQEAQGEAVMFFQLSVDRQGLISGAYTNVVSGEELPVSGQVDRTTQRAAWHIGKQTEKVFEAGLANLTQEQASCLVHFAPGEMQTWLLVRLPDPSLPSQPADLSAAGSGAAEGIRLSQ